MVTKLILALTLPALLVVLFTRVTYNYIIGTGLAIALIVASVFKGYTHTWLIGLFDVISLGAGFWYSKRMYGKDKK
ncbi:CsbA family protein [Bacillus timonensis]|nr:CsbA family protein [Bacillus timonensis]